MTPESIKEYISEGLSSGINASDLKNNAIQNMGVGAQDFDRAYDLILLSEQAPALEVPKVESPELVQPQPMVSQPEIARPVVLQPIQSSETQTIVPANKIEMTTPAVAKKGGFFNWFRVHKTAVIVLVLICILSGGGYVAANALMAPNVNEVRGLIFEQLQDMESVVYKGSIEGEITTDAAISLDNILKNDPLDTIASISEGRVAGSQNTKVRVDFNGAMDVRDINSPKSEFSFTVTAADMTFGLETKTINDDLFLKLSQVPDFGVAQINQLIGQWLKIDLKELQEQIGGELPTRNESLTLEQKQRILEVFKTANVFKMAERIGSETVNGKSAHHYRYVLDEDGLISMIEQLADIFGQSQPFTMQDKEEFKDWLDSAGGEIWVAKKDLTPVKMTFEILMRSVSNAPVSGRLSFNIDFNKFNEEVSIEAPYPFKSLADILNEYQEKSSVSSRDARRLADVRQLLTAVELYYNDYGSYPNTLDQLMNTEPKFLQAIPFSPQPPDGTCTPIQNEYIYKPSLKNQDYTVQFCLGEDTGGYKAGLRTASTSGIK